MVLRNSRRDFLKAGVLAGVGFHVGTTTVTSAPKSPNEKLNIAMIGVGGRGGANLQSVGGENIVALVDVNGQNLDKAAEKHPRALKLTDFRKLYDHANDFDAVVVSTTEHTHSFATLPALQLGKHVYCEKPLCHTVWETRVITEAAAKAKVVTQMGTQIHAGDNYRRVVELVQAGAVGPITDVHVFVSRDWGGGERPKEAQAIPDYLNWDLWLGAAPERPFHSEYFPGPKWYKWWDFGGGTMPDLGSHWIDLPFWALKLKHPLTIEAEGPPPHPETAPTQLIVRYEYPARGDMPGLNLTWYHGGKRPKMIADRLVPDWKDGVLFVGTKGMILSDYGKHVLLPEKEFAGYKRPEQSIPKSIGHHAEWIKACKEGTPTTCPFEYSGLLTEANLLGIVAYRTSEKLQWDPKELKAKNCAKADAYIRKEFRKGWKLV